MNIKEMEETILAIFRENPTSETVVDLHNKYCVGKCKTNSYPCFWSCRPGRTAAYNDPLSYTDADCYVVNLLFQHHKNCLAFEISRAYASFARGTVLVYMGSDKMTEPVGFHVGNNFWIAELPTLQRMLREGKIENILLRIVGEGRTISMKSGVIDLPLWQRQWRPHNGEETKRSYVSQVMSEDDWEQWRRAPPRKYITYSRMLEIVRRWKTLTRVVS